MSVPREGGCSCGAVRYRLESDPLFVHCCHCLNCQRQTGSAFVLNVLIEADRLELLAGEPRPIPVPRDDGSEQTIWRCPACQIALFSRYTSRRIRFVRAGTLDDPASVTPDVHIYTRSKLPWIVLPGSVPAFEEFYETRKLWPPASLERLEALKASAGADGAASLAPDADLVTIETLERLVDAFNAHDLDAVMSFFADDCVLEMPRGPDPWGRRMEGREQVRDGLASRFAGIPDVHYGDDRHWLAGDRGCSEWLLTGTSVQGERIEVRGCDLFELRDGKIVRKDSYWKIVEE